MKIMKKLILRLLWGRRITAAANAVADGTYEHSKLSLTPDAALTSTYLLGTFGSDANHVVAAGTGAAALFVIYDSYTAIDLLGTQPVMCQVIGGGGNTQLMRAGGVIAAGDRLCQTTLGRVITYTSGSAYFVGRALTAASGDGEQVMVASVLPVSISA